MRVAAVLVLTCGVGLTLVAQQTPPRDTRKPSTETAVVSGRVTDRDTGQPLRRIKIQLSALSPSGTGRMFEAETGADGRYAFSEIPAGEYYASASPGQYRADYQVQSFGFTKGASPFGRPPPLDLRAGETREDVDFALARAFAIEGRILSEYGEPLADIMVGAEGRSGGRSLPTDDRGYFRLYGLAPGEWRVCASPGNNSSGMPWERPTGGDVVQARFVKSCFPAEAAAPPLTIKSADVTGIVIQMMRARAFTLSGHVVDESGTTVERAFVTLQRMDRSPFTTEIPVEFKNGSFVARGLTPGEYLLRATVQDPSGPSLLFTPAASPRELGYMPLTIDAADMTGVLVTTTRGADVAGRITFEGEAPPSIGSARPRIITRRDFETEATFRFLPTPSAPIEEDLTFELTRIHGPVIIGLGPLPAGWIIKTVRYGTADITDMPTEFPRGADPRRVDITLTNRAARVIPVTTDENGQLNPAAVVVLIPADSRRWKGGVITLWERTLALSARSSAVPPSLVRPGDYIVAAVSGEDLRFVRTMEAVKTIAERGQRVTLRENEDHRIEVRVIKLSGSL